MRKLILIAILMTIASSIYSQRTEIRLKRLEKAGKTGAIIIAGDDSLAVWSDSLVFINELLMTKADTFATRSWARDSLEGDLPSSLDNNYLILSRSDSLVNSALYQSIDGNIGIGTISPELSMISGFSKGLSVKNNDPNVSIHFDNNTNSLIGGLGIDASNMFIDSEGGISIRADRTNSFLGMPSIKLSIESVESAEFEDNRIRFFVPSTFNSVAYFSNTPASTTGNIVLIDPITDQLMESSFSLDNFNLQEVTDRGATSTNAIGIGGWLTLGDDGLHTTYTNSGSRDHKFYTGSVESFKISTTEAYAPVFRTNNLSLGNSGFQRVVFGGKWTLASSTVSGENEEGILFRNGEDIPKVFFDLKDDKINFAHKTRIGYSDLEVEPKYTLDVNGTVSKDSEIYGSNNATVNIGSVSFNQYTKRKLYIPVDSSFIGLVKIRAMYPNQGQYGSKGFITKNIQLNINSTNSAIAFQDAWVSERLGGEIKIGDFQQFGDSVYVYIYYNHLSNRQLNIELSTYANEDGLKILDYYLGPIESSSLDEYPDEPISPVGGSDFLVEGDLILSNDQDFYLGGKDPSPTNKLVFDEGNTYIVSNNSNTIRISTGNQIHSLSTDGLTLAAGPTIRKLGTETNPSYTFDPGYPSTGLYRVIGTNDIGITTNGTTAAIFKQNTNLELKGKLVLDDVTTNNSLTTILGRNSVTNEVEAMDVSAVTPWTVDETGNIWFNGKVGAGSDVVSSASSFGFGTTGEMRAQGGFNLRGPQFGDNTRSGMFTSGSGIEFPVGGSTSFKLGSSGGSVSNKASVSGSWNPPSGSGTNRAFYDNTNVRPFEDFTGGHHSFSAKPVLLKAIDEIIGFHFSPSGFPQDSVGNLYAFRSEIGDVFIGGQGQLEITGKLTTESTATILEAGVHNLYIHDGTVTREISVENTANSMSKIERRTETVTDANLNLGTFFLTQTWVREITYTVGVSSIATSDSQVTLPTPSFALYGSRINIIAFDDNSSYSVTMAAGTNEIYNNGYVTTISGSHQLECTVDPLNTGEYIWTVIN